MMTYQKLFWSYYTALTFDKSFKVVYFFKVSDKIINVVNVLKKRKKKEAYNCFLNILLAE